MTSWISGSGVNFNESMERLVGVPPLALADNRLPGVHIWDPPPTSLRLCLPLLMPISKFLRRFFSKSSSGSSSRASLDAAPTIRTEETPSNTSTIADPDVPRHSEVMREAHNVTNVEFPQPRGVERFLSSVGRLTLSIQRRLHADINKEIVEEKVTLSEGHQVVLSTFAAPTMLLLDTPQIADGIEQGVNAFMETVPVLMKALDEVARIHPFIGGMDESVTDTQVLIGDLPGAVAAFKAVYVLEVTRRNNDQRVIVNPRT